MQALEFDLLIIGGGVVGLTAALALSNLPIRVALVDAKSLHEDIKTNARVYAINKASRLLFERIGVWSMIDEGQKSAYDHMHVWDARSGASIDFDSRLIHQSELGFIVSETSLKKALLQKINSAGSVKLFGSEAIEGLALQDHKAYVQSQKQNFQAPYLIIADGGESPLRKQLQVPMTSWPYHQYAMTATVHTAMPHQKTAWQVFTPTGPLAFLPLVNKNQCSIVWSTTEKQAKHLSQCAEAEFNQALEQAFEHRLGAVHVASPRQRFPLVMRQAKQYAGDNWLLIGDAAHTIHPLAGLGLNLGLADVACLLGYIEKTKNRGFSKKALGQYQRDRKAKVWQSIAYIEALKTLFASPMTPVAHLRGLGLACCDRLTPLKRFFIEHASG